MSGGMHSHQSRRHLTVVQIVPELDEGGVEQSTLEVATHLARQGHTAIVISRGGRLVPQIIAAGGRHLTYSFVGEKSPRCLLHILPLHRLLRHYRADILHLRSRLPAWVGYLAWRGLPPAQRPALVTTFHGFYSVNPYSAVMTKGQRIIAVSKVIKNHIQHAYHIPARRITLIPRGFDADRYDPAMVGRDRIAALEHAWGMADRTVPLIFFPGRLTRLKGHALLIESLARIRRLPWITVCAGDLHSNPDLTVELQKQVRAHGLADRIRFVGHCEDMPAALMLARVVVVPSIQPEAFGRTAVEAQAMGVPVVATAHGGSLETILDGKTGWLVHHQAPEAMASALARTITDHERAARLGHAGQQWVRTRFSTHRMLDETLRLYTEVVFSGTTRR